MGRKRLFPIIAALAVLVLSATACEDTGYSGQPAAAHVTPTPRPFSGREVVALETAQAEETTAALESVAKSTADALEIEKRATQQALDLRGTQDAQESAATRQAWEFSQTQQTANVQATAEAEARQATATRVALNATATAEARQATATRQAIDATTTAAHDQATSTAVQWAANVQGTQSAADAFAVEATRRAVERADERERVTQPLRAWWVWVLLAVAIPALGWFGWRVAQVMEARARVIRRGPDEGEPFIMLTRDRIAAPARMFNALMSGDEIPALPSPEMQDAATMRQQTANAIQARQVAATVKAKKAHKTKPPQVVARAAPALPRRPQARRRRQIPGIVKVVGVNSLEDATREGILPPPLAEAIEGQWEVIDGED